MTTEELDIHTELSNQFYEAYGKLLAQYINKAPESIRDEFIMKLSELSNPYSSCWKDYL